MIIVQLLALYLGGTPLFGQVGGTNLLTRGPGAEAAALAGAIAPTVQDPTALYWNPAGLASAGGMVTGEHLFLFDGARYDFVGLSVPSKLGTFGLGALQLNRDGIVARSAIDDTGASVSNTQTAYLAGFGRGLGEHWAVGATANILDFSVAGHKDKGWGLDAGTQASYPQDDFIGLKRVAWSFGAAIKNLVQPKITLMADPETVPRELRGGAGISFQTASRASATGTVSHDRATALVSLRRASGDPALYPGLGLSYSYEKVLIFRLGFDGDLSAGFGFHTMDDKFILDYAMENKPLSLNHRFTISYRFIPALSKSQEVFREEIDDEYARAKGQAESLAQESYASGLAMFKAQQYRESLEPLRLAALLAPDHKDLAQAYRRSQEAYRRDRIRRIYDEDFMAPGNERKAYDSIGELLDLGADDGAKLAEVASKLPGRILPDDYARLSQEAFEQRSLKARRLLAAAHIAQSLDVVGALDVLKSSSAAPAAEALRQEITSKGRAIREEFEALYAVNDGRPGAGLVRAALAVKRAFPADAALVEKAKGTLSGFQRNNPLTIKERFYLRKLYYLAAMRYVKRGPESLSTAAGLLAEILRRDPADEDADALSDAIALEGLAGQ